MLKLRPATPEDAPLILQYIRELAEYERDPKAAVATEADILRHAFSEHPLIHVVLAEWEGQPAGFALYFFNFSTWQGKPGLYLEDLFVRPSFRGFGIGKALLKHLARIAVDRGCTRYVWQVLDWNEPSIKFYEAQGARLMKDWITCRVDGEALVRMAEGAP
jgi:GNAT superfamily N-acetyltransferase